jgi:alkylation response protein AidB-like acyl-CoA dehydrogenase
MHGGIGMTDEHVAGRYLKWARVSEMLYGNRDALAERYASAHGY